MIITGKYGIGKTSLVTQTAKLHGQTWRFLFADFSHTPAEMCHDLLAALRSPRPSRKYTQYVPYKQARSLIMDLASKDARQCVIVLDNIATITPQKLALMRYLAWDTHILFVALAERFLPEDDLFRLRTYLFPSNSMSLRHLSTTHTAEFFRYCATKYRFRWSESDIRMLTLTTKGYPLAMREFVTRELARTERKKYPVGLP